MSDTSSRPNEPGSGPVPILAQWTGDGAATIGTWAEQSAADPGLALASLVRWAQATTHPETQLQALLDSPGLGRWVVTLMGASQQTADIFVQNPEFVSWITDPSFLLQPPSREGVVREGDALLRVASGYTHKLDRLRYLKQAWTLRILLNDLAGTWSQPDVWRAISDLAEGLCALALDAAIEEYAGLRGIHEPCPISVIAFGKLGGRELNYSSDIDLVLVRASSSGAWDEVHCSRLAEMLNRAMADAMGRGFLYRVDFRLRPFGSAGPMVPTMTAAEAYYRSHAEEWEYQALLRSRWIAGEPGAAESWEQMRQTYCFRPKLAESAIESVVTMREQIEGQAAEDDLKCGRGGIRDAEFYVQTLQRIYGFGNPEVQARFTLDAIDGLKRVGALEGVLADQLAEDYCLLRQVEHRLQIGGRQLHTLPKQPEELGKLAHLMRFPSAETLLERIAAVRDRLRGQYGTLTRDWVQGSARGQVLASAGNLGPALALWIDGLPQSAAYYSSLHENEISLSRALALIERAPQLVDSMRGHVGLSEAVLSGEIEEDVADSELNRDVASQPDLAKLATAVQYQRVRIWWRFALGDIRLEDATRAYADLADRTLRWIVNHVDGTFDVVAVGSFGMQTLGPASDLDLLILCERSESQSDSEKQAQAMLETIAQSRQLGMPFQVDIRLRPEGNKGLLARTYDAIRLYEITSMEMWERFALGSCRLVLGSERAMDLVLWAAYNQPLTPERLDELLAMKLRIETERVEQKYAWRHVKLGVGALADIEWFVRLHEMRYPTATEAQGPRSLFDRLQSLARARLVHAGELEELLEAARHLIAVRIHVWLLKYPADVIPENPTRLDHLGHLFGFEDGNAFLASHESIVRRVRQIYNEGIERLRK